MCADTRSNQQAVAVEQLEEFGLSSYAARTYVALASLGTGTAREVSQVSDVPRTRVYDAVDELKERGLVDVQQSSPKEFWAISAETATRTFEREVEHRAKTLRTALSELEPESKREEQRGVWTVDGTPTVTDRVVEFIGNADSEIVYMTVEGLLTNEIIDALADASDRGVSVYIGGVSTAVEDRLKSDVPDAETFESLWMWTDTPAGRLLMTDRETTLVSALVNGPDASVADPRSETAIWGQGEHNSLVAVLNGIFTWRLDTEQ